MGLSVQHLWIILLGWRAEGHLDGWPPWSPGHPRTRAAESKQANCSRPKSSDLFLVLIVRCFVGMVPGV